MRTWLRGKRVKAGEGDEVEEEEARSMGKLQLAQARARKAASVCL